VSEGVLLLWASSLASKGMMVTREDSSCLAAAEDATTRDPLQCDCVYTGVWRE